VARDELTRRGEEELNPEFGSVDDAVSRGGEGRADPARRGGAEPRVRFGRRCDESGWRGTSWPGEPRRSRTQS